MAETVSYKGYLSFNGEDEVRKFMIDKSVAFSYDYLVEKVKTMFPAIRNKILKISWTDDEGDSVTIASNEELMIALTEMTGPVYKVNIRVRDVIGGGSQQGAGAGGQDGDTGNGGEGEEHPGVVCAQRAKSRAGSEEKQQGGGGGVVAQLKLVAQVALKAMMNKCFSNKGGWLATLLKAIVGDTVQALLQPVKKYLM